MTRKLCVLIHRFAGLYMAFFLVVAGLTGSLIVFYRELDDLINPQLHHVTPVGTAIDAPTLIKLAEAEVPDAWATSVAMPRTPDQPVSIRLEPRIDPDTGQLYQLRFSRLYLYMDPYTGKVVGRETRVEGETPNPLESSANVMPFIMRLHYSLALGKPGVWLFGIAAIIWTVDAFVAFYLTLPLRKRREAHIRHASTSADAIAQRSFWQRWKPSWCIKWKAGAARINFDLHRAFGLWLWPMLLVFAWSSVGLNLNAEVYQPVMRLFFDMHDPIADIPAKVEPVNTTNLDWAQSLRKGRELMAMQSELEGFVVKWEGRMHFDRATGLFVYAVHSDQDIGVEAATVVAFDAESGALMAFNPPSSRASLGQWLTSWIVALHFGSVFGLPYRVFVCVLGVATTLLSATGVLIWLKKQKRYESRRRIKRSP